MSAITNYSDVIPLEQVKLYLRFDETECDVDHEIGFMRDSACQLVEAYSNYRIKPQAIDYYFQEGYVNVYDFPIVTVDNAVGTYKRTNKGLYSQFEDCSTLDNDNTPLTINLGYTDTTQNVPPILIQAVLETVRVWFFSAESDSMKGALPELAMSMLNPIKRFIF